MLEDISLEETLIGYYTWSIGQNLVYLDAVASRLRDFSFEEASHGIPVEAFEPGHVIGPGADAPESPGGLVAAAGLALQGLGLAPVSLNLVAASQRDAQVRRVRGATYLASGVCAAAAIGLALSAYWLVWKLPSRL